MRLVVLALIIAPSLAHAQEAREVTLVKQLFAELNPLSIEDDTEYCGYVGLDADGALTATPATTGDEGSCLSDDPDMLEVVFASYHTHGAYSPDYYNEVPSGEDMEGDADEGIDGWLATPGGRLWYIDSVDMVASQICGPGCLPADPDFVPGDMGKVQLSYSYDELVEALDY